MNIKIGEFTDWELIQLDLFKTDIDRFRSIINDLISDLDQINTKKIVEFFNDKIDYILDINLINEELQIDGYKIVWFWEFKKLLDWEKVLEIKIAWNSKTRKLYLTKNFEVFKINLWNKVYHIWKITPYYHPRRETYVCDCIWLIVENWEWAFPLRQFDKYWEIQTGVITENPFTSSKK